MVEFFCRMFDMLKTPGVALFALLLAAWCVRELTLFLRRVGMRGSAAVVLSGLAFAAMWSGGEVQRVIDQWEGTAKDDYQIQIYDVTPQGMVNP